MTSPARPPARRSIVKGAAWAVPAVTVAAAAPAAAASPACVVAERASVCRDTVLFVFARYTFSVDLRNTCASPVTVQATVTAQTSGGAESTGQVSRTIAAGATTRVSGTYDRFLDWTASPTSISVTYSIGGVAAGSRTFTRPWSCTPAPTGLQAANSGSLDARMPSDEEIRAHLEANPELMQQKEVQALLEEHPEWAPRTSARSEQASVPEPTASRTEQSIAPEEPTDAPEPTVDAEQPTADSEPSGEGVED